MKQIRIRTPFAILLVALVALPLIAQSIPQFIQWANSVLDDDQSGAIELGANDLGNKINPISGGKPYIDFHYGNGLAQDFNARVINDGDNSLSFATAIGGTVLNIGGSEMLVNGGVNPNGTGIKHARTSASCTTSSSQGSTCIVTLTWPGAPFPDANYTVVCTPQNGTGSQKASAFVFVPTSTRTTTSVGVGIETLNSLNATLAGVDCIAMHD